MYLMPAQRGAARIATDRHVISRGRLGMILMDPQGEIRIFLLFQTLFNVTTPLCVWSFKFTL